MEVYSSGNLTLSFYQFRDGGYCSIIFLDRDNCNLIQRNSTGYWGDNESLNQLNNSTGFAGGNNISGNDN